MTKSLDSYEFLLWDWSASDCSARLRITMNLKGIPYHRHNVDLASGERMEEATNPARTVPTLQISFPDSRSKLTLTQSLSAMEYLEEAFPNTTTLLPPLSEPEARAHVRTLVQIVATDIHPLTTHRVGDGVAKTSDLSEAIADWDLHWMQRGLTVYEKHVASRAGRYSFGDTITMADVCLWPSVSTARKTGLDLKQFQAINEIFENLNAVPAFKEDPHVTWDISRG